VVQKLGHLGRQIRNTWRSMYKICWNDCVIKEEILHSANGERNVAHRAKRRKVKRIGFILHRHCFLEHIIVGKIEGMIEVTGRQGRRRK
jgi:hypothetical protein